MSEEPRESRRSAGTIVVEDEALRQGFTQIPNVILRRPDASPGAKLTYMALLSYAWQDGSCFPGQQKLAQDIGVTARSVITYLKQLQELGLLVVKRRGLGLTNVYVLPRLRAQSRSENSALPEVKDSAGPEVKQFHVMDKDSREEDPAGRTSKLRRQPAPNRSALDAAPTSANGHVEQAIPSRVRPSGDQVTREPTASDVEAVNNSAAPPPARRPLRARLAPEERRRYDQERRAIVDYLADFARELGDAAPLASSVTRAVNIQRAAGVDLDAFAEALYHARAVTKEHWAAIRTESTRPGASWSTKRAMPYFFAELERVLGLRELPETPAEHAARTAAEAAERDRAQQRAGRGDARAGPPRAWIETYQPRRRRGGGGDA